MMKKLAFLLAVLVSGMVNSQESFISVGGGINATKLVGNNSDLGLGYIDDWLVAQTYTARFEKNVYRRFQLDVFGGFTQKGGGHKLVYSDNEGANTAVYKNVLISNYASAGLNVKYLFPIKTMKFYVGLINQLDFNVGKTYEHINFATVASMIDKFEYTGDIQRGIYSVGGLVGVSKQFGKLRTGLDVGSVYGLTPYNRTITITNETLTEYSFGISATLHIGYEFDFGPKPARLKKKNK